MSDAHFAGASGPVAPRPPFSVGSNLNQIDEQLAMLIERTSNIRNRLVGQPPEAPQATRANAGNLEAVCEHIEDKMRALNNIVATIDNAV